MWTLKLVLKCGIEMEEGIRYCTCWEYSHIPHVGHGRNKAMAVVSRPQEDPQRERGPMR